MATVVKQEEAADATAGAGAGHSSSDAGDSSSGSSYTESESETESQVDKDDGNSSIRSFRNNQDDVDSKKLKSQKYTRKEPLKDDLDLQK